MTKKDRPAQKLPGKDIVNEDEACVCFNLRKAARVVTHIYDEVMRPLGYRGTQITLLGVISRFQPMTVKHLAEIIDTDPTTLLRNLRLLEKERLAAMNQDEKDGRVQIVTLTAKGAEVLRKAYPLWKKTQDRIAKKVGRKRLNKILSDLQEALEAMSQRPEEKSNPGGFA